MKEVLIITIIALLVPFLVNLFFIPMIIRISHKHKIFDEKDERKTHDGDISRLGGLGIFLSFLIGASVIYSVTNQYLQYLIPVFIQASGFIILFSFSFLLGFADDLITLRARHKLFIQIGIGLGACAFQLTINSLVMPFTNITFMLATPIACLLTMIWMIGATNALNLMDGMDGLAGGIANIACFFLGGIAFYHGYYVTAILCFLLAGSTLGYLFFNFPPAKIFMGDGGSYQLGFFVAMVPLLGLTGKTGLDFAIVITLLIIPVMDTFSAMIRRKMQGKHFFEPDRGHLHHKLMDWGFSRRRVLSIIYSAMILLGCVSFYLSVNPGILGWALLSFTWIFTAVCFIQISIHHKAKTNRLKIVDNKKDMA